MTDFAVFARFIDTFGAAVVPHEGASLIAVVAFLRLGLIDLHDSILILFTGRILVPPCIPFFVVIFLGLPVVMSRVRFRPPSPLPGSRP